MDFQSKKAIYLQIADFVCEKVLLNEWKEKEKIPSIRDLAVTLEVNPNTVMRTYTFLVDKNIIEMQRGVGYFLTQKALSHTLKFKKEAFLKEDLPYLFRSMDLLNIPLEDFQALYERREKSESKQ